MDRADTSQLNLEDQVMADYQGEVNRSQLEFEERIVQEQAQDELRQETWQLSEDKLTGSNWSESDSRY